VNTETITWNDACLKLPDSDSTVLISCPTADEPVWLGYHDGEDWFAVDGGPALVVAWAKMPKGWPL
jgi:hypothetical protein